MKVLFKILAAVLVLGALLLGCAALWYLHTKQPQRKGDLPLRGLSAAVTVRYDERGVPHIQAENEADMYRALGYVHAQDRLFQMEILRRLANGELAEILGPRWLESDKLFRTLGLQRHAVDLADHLDPTSAPGAALLAYLDGVNQYLATRPAPVEFDLLKIPKRPFTPTDTLAVSGYLAYSFASAFKTVPVMTYIRDKLGPEYLKDFDTEWHPEGVMDAAAQVAEAAEKPSPKLANRQARSNATGLDWQALTRLSQASQAALELGGVPQFQGSNAWALSGAKAQGGKPMLAGDPHISFAVPAVWYEAHLSAPGFDLYGHYQALIPFAMLGHNQQFGWSLTLLGNADLDLIAQKVNPENANQVWLKDQWVDLKNHTEVIKVKDAENTLLRLRFAPQGPIVTDAFKQDYGHVPVAMWWSFLQSDTSMLATFYALNRADTLDKARAAASTLAAPGLNLVWASASGDIGWWAAAKLVQRPERVNPLFILDAGTGEDEKPGYYAFAYNPQEENPARGYIVSANQQPLSHSGIPVPGYYAVPDRAQHADAQFRDPDKKWTMAALEELQLDACSNYPVRMLKDLLPVMQQVATDPNEKAFLEPLQKWDGCYTRDSVAATLFTQFSYELARALFAEPLGEVQFNNLLGSVALDHALPLVAANAKSRWWHNVDAPQVGNRFETVRIAWTHTLQHLQGLYGTSLLDWTWGHTHSLTQRHPLGDQRGLGLLFNVGPFSVPGGGEASNNMTQRPGPAPWSTSIGPSTRRVIDFSAPYKAVGINPLGQSGVLFDRYYADQAERFTQGIYAPEYLSPQDIQTHSRGTLTLQPQ